MRRTPNRPGPRAGFTLVELLVVITIIAILFALTSAAVVKALGKGDEVRTRNDISQLSSAIQAYKTHFAVAYLPSTFTIRNTYAASDPDIVYLKSVWPRLAVTAGGTPANPTITVNSWGPFLSAAATATTPLTGNQCLVLFLGGPDGVSGFSNSPTNPMATGGNRIGPFFDFPQDRLAGSAPFRFNDVFGTPYVYFSTRQAANDYPINANNTVVGTSVVTPTGTYTVYPYQISGNIPTATTITTPRVWASKSGFQIISAGKNQGFYDLSVPGNYAGGLNWPGGNGSTSGDGYYNMANFHPTLLGIANN